METIEENTISNDENNTLTGTDAGNDADTDDKAETWDCAYELKLSLLSKRNALQILLPERCDFEQSWILLDGVQLEELDTAMQLPLAPGEYELSWYLADEHGCLIESDTKVFSIEAVPPRLDLVQNDIRLSELTLLKSDLVLDLESDIELAKIQVYVDGALAEDFDGRLCIGKNVKQVRISAADAFGNESEKEWNFIAAPILQNALSIEQVYNGNLLLEFDAALSPGFYLEAEGQSIELADLAQVPVLLKEEGAHTLRLMHENLGEIASYEVYNQHISPSVSLVQTSGESGTKIEAVSQDAQSCTLFIKQKDVWMPVNGLSHFAAAPQDDTELYEYKALMIDLAGQGHESYGRIFFDTRLPKMELLLNGQPVPSGSVTTFSTLNSLDTYFSGSCSELKIEGAASSFENALQALTDLQDGQSLQLFYEVQQTNGLKQNFAYTFVYEKKQALLQDDALEKDVAFELDKDGSVQLKLQPSKNSGNSAAIMITQNYQDLNTSEKLQAGQSVRIWLEDSSMSGQARFESLIINGKPVEESKILRNELNQPYYDLVLEKENYSVQVKAVDAMGNTLEKDVIFEVELTGFPAVLAMAGFIGVLAGMAFLIRRLFRMLRKRHA